MVTTVKLNSGVVVLGKTTEYGLSAVTYANRTQANKAAAKLVASGVKAEVIHRGRPFYVMVTETELAAS